MSEIPAADNDSVEALISEVADEFLERWEHGEQPEVEEYARRYPHLAEALRQVLPALPLLRHSGAVVLDPWGAWQPDVPLGDYRLVREIGRGGMGVVYEAVQLSLGRRVALKVLPFAAALDAKQLQRFKNEAQAAAHLEHPHIVPVYAVGCERGVHFYAMKLIDGHTLAAVIHELRQLRQRPAPEPSAAVSAASALAAELLSGGWAPAKDAPSPGPATGPDLPASEGPSVLATTPPVAALSTERSATSPAFFRTVAHLGVQAAEALEHAHQLGVIHRDIKPANLLVDAGGRLWVTDFGLAHYQNQPGLTLSGDLVGTLRYMSPEQGLGPRAAVDARADIYSLGVTLYELLTLESAYGGRNREELLRQIAFEEPRPPRRLNQAVPAELETIVLKAMAKSPQERYATAQELADDLRRFLEDKPIRARRPTLLQRARKWARRHKAVFVSAAGLLAVAVLALAVGSVLLTAAYRAEADQRRRAEAKEQLARQAVDEMYTQVAQKWLAEQPDLQPVQREFLLKALRFYEEFAQDPRTEPALRRKAGEAYRRVGAIQYRLGEYQKADEALVRALALVEQLAAELPAVPEYRADLAATYGRRGQLLQLTGRLAEAEEAYARALALGERLAADAPTRPEYRHDLAVSRSHLGRLLLLTGRRGEAEQAFRQAATTFAKLAEEFPDEPAHAKELAANRHHLGTALRLGKQLGQAEEAFRQALVPLQKLSDRFPADPAYAYNLATTHGSLGLLLLDTGQAAEAEQAFLEVRAVCEKLVARFPSVPAYRHGLAFAHDKLGFVHWKVRRPAEAGVHFGRARPLLEQLVHDFPQVADYQNGLAEALQHLAVLAYEQARFDEAGPLADRAIHHQQLALKANPRNHDYRQGLRTQFCLRAGVLVRQGKHAEAAQAAAALSRCGVSPEQDAEDAAETLTLCAPLAEQDTALPESRRQQVAQAYREQAEELRRHADRARTNAAASLKHPD